jgi:hypothetical protein
VQDHSNWTEAEWALRHPDGTAAPIPSCANDFDCVPHGVPFRPDRLTVKPKVPGPQTALVVGEEGKEIDTDEYGRVKVKFQWDRAPEGAPVVSTAVPIRVSQGWAGAGWGQIHVPRVGQEVIVDFLNGDPDRPIITGRVYDVDNAVPYTLPGNAAQSGIRTRSTPGGTADNYNELRFDDSKGSEQVLLHAERDYVVEVENNESRTIGIGGGIGDRTTAIKHNETVTIGGDRRVTITGNAMDTIDGSETRSVIGDVTESVSGAVTINVSGSVLVNSDSEITLKAPTVTTDSTAHNRYTKVYDWDQGSGYGSFYLTVNYQAVLATNAFATVVNVAGYTINVGFVTMNFVPFVANVGVAQVSNRQFSDENHVVSMQDVVTRLGNYATYIQTGLMTIFR